jgi:hypothetical protein
MTKKHNLSVPSQIFFVHFLKENVMTGMILQISCIHNKHHVNFVDFTSFKVNWLLWQSSVMKQYSVLPLASFLFVQYKAVNVINWSVWVNKIVTAIGVIQNKLQTSKNLWGSIHNLLQMQSDI